MYHQRFVQGGQIIHISSEPLAIKSVVINKEISAKPDHVPEAAEPLKNPPNASTTHP